MFVSGISDFHQRSSGSISSLQQFPIQATPSQSHGCGTVAVPLWMNNELNPQIFDCQSGTVSPVSGLHHGGCSLIAGEVPSFPASGIIPVHPVAHLEPDLAPNMTQDFDCWPSTECQSKKCVHCRFALKPNQKHLGRRACMSSLMPINSLRG